MSILICGSLAFDTIMTFEGRFAEQILPSQLHILNVSFLVPGLRREFGGCAGNIAYGLRQLGVAAQPVASLGSDGQGYLDRLQALGVDTQQVAMVDGMYTAQAMIMTDRDNNQITAFHPGAMAQAHHNPLRTEGATLVISEDYEVGLVFLYDIPYIGPIVTGDDFSFWIFFFVSFYPLSQCVDGGFVFE